ncbi:Xaa-Pro dipeptidase [Thalassovita gelatinovora]|uniref:Xaa-Pro dipeptidase n=1 Tax=Thalassovita gelatinovora TaxID=53501 RepID=A0A0P1FCL3_THAGE|nr:Xaa-Pro peptidase family protein [Thalassovita gelatinovora]QIZ80441.1 aminopeptidase P family protein [Thalassovita gelatinovora]CUH65838.1 Xaa-Pro dipeptidase [Thalassovita gelatinovora]SEQ72552.1 Xaa-Pro aminopeptidase [Thalassovita gelatinovora]
MAEPLLIFPTAEYRLRVERLQRRMQAAGQDALLLTTPADVFYVTGFLTRFWESPARPWFIIVPASGRPIAVIPAIGADLMRRCWVTDIRTWDAPNPEDDGVSLLADTLAGLVPETGCIGVPMQLETHLRMPLADYARVGARIAPRRFVDATDTVQRVREVKSEAEIEKIRVICGVADRAFARVPEFSGAGRPLDLVFRDFQIALLQEGADWVSYVAGGAGPGGYGDVISPAGPQPLALGDVLMLDTGAVRDGYFCDFDRNYAIGRADDGARRAHAALFAATDTALAELRPGMTALDLHGVLTGALRAHGATPGGGRLGHGLGLTLTEWPSVTAKDDTVLREGMVLTLEPGVEIEPGKIMVHEENLVLRADGAELLSTRTQPDLPEIH